MYKVSCTFLTPFVSFRCAFGDTLDGSWQLAFVDSSRSDSAGGCR